MAGTAISQPDSRVGCNQGTRQQHTGCVNYRSESSRNNPPEASCLGPKKQMRPGQPPDRIRTWIPAPTSSPLGGGMTALARQRSRRSAAFAKTSREFVILRSRTCSFNGASGPMSCSEKQVGEEAATPRQPVALARVFWSVPRQFTLENRRLPLALPQSFGKLRNYHVSLNPLSASLLRLATQKSSAIVQKLWTMRLPCGSQRKTKN